MEAKTMRDRDNVIDGVVSTGVEPPNKITVLFDDSTLSFPMSASATLADLAERLGEEGGPDRQMLSVTVKLGGAIGFRRQSRRQETPWPATGSRHTGLRNFERRNALLF
jgi:hypothetical protein